MDTFIKTILIFLVSDYIFLLLDICIIMIKKEIENFYSLLKQTFLSNLFPYDKISYGNFWRSSHSAADKCKHRREIILL